VSEGDGHVKLDLGAKRSRLGCVWRGGCTSPLASAWTLWSRLCSVNAFSPLEAKRVLEGRSVFKSVFDTEMNVGWLQEAHDLGLQARADACAVHHRFDPGAVVRHQLRYCPACMALEYHAACFQHRALTRCPVHDVLLREGCAGCGRPVLTHHEAARRVPFGCARCGSWLVPPQRSIDKSERGHPALQATTAALDRAHAHHSVCRLRGLPILQGGHSTWWWGEDPYVAGSWWRPWTISLAAGPESPDALHARAWNVLVGFVERMQRGPGGLDLPTRLAEAIERHDGSALRWGARGALLWGLAALISHYGGPRATSQAYRLRVCGARPELYPITPQVSTPVEGNAQANALVFEAELRGQLLRLVRRIRRHGVDIVFEEDERPNCAVPWHLAPNGNDRCTLQWRGLGARRFERCLQNHLPVG